MYLRRKKRGRYFCRRMNALNKKKFEYKVVGNFNILGQGIYLYDSFVYKLKI